MSMVPGGLICLSGPEPAALVPLRFRCHNDAVTGGCVSLVLGLVDPVLLLDGLLACWCRLSICFSCIFLSIPSRLFSPVMYTASMITVIGPTASCFSLVGHCWHWNFGCVFHSDANVTFVPYRLCLFWAYVTSARLSHVLVHQGISCPKDKAAWYGISWDIQET